MISKNELSALIELKSIIYETIPESREIDIKPLAKDLGLDMDKIMAEVIEICENENYVVGDHMVCTRVNVIPEYKESGSLVLDRDHVEGLSEILGVHYGLWEDY